MSSMNIPTEVKGLDISLSMILASQKDEEARAKTFLKDVESKFEKQSKLEKEYLANSKWVCPPSVEDAVLEKTSNLNLSPSDREEDSKMVLDSSSLNHLACVAQNIHLFDGPNMRTGYNFIRQLITNVRIIGDPSVNGVAMKADLYNKYKDMIVIKAPRNPGPYNDEAVNHEVVVGKVLNELRSYVPNFSFVLGSFECGPPIVSPGPGPKSKDKIISWCRSGTQVKYIMYENIDNAQSLYSFCESCSPQEYIDIMLQINHALMVAYKKKGFTHYDLHGYNILVKKVKGFEDGFYIPYAGDFVYANYLACFIDYGYSHVYINGKESVGFKDDHGPRYNLGMFKNGIYMDQPHPLHDCYSILQGTIMYMKGRNDSTYEAVKGLLYYFHPRSEDLKAVMKVPNGVSVPKYGNSDYMARIEKFRYESFIRYCREYCLLNDMNDPVVSGRDYDPELDGGIVFSPNSRNMIVPDVEKPLNLRDKISTLEELFDIIEPLVSFKEYLPESSKSIPKEKLIAYDTLFRNVFTMIRKETPFITELLQKEISNIEDRLENMKPATYRNTSTEGVYLLRSSVSLRNYLKMFEESVAYLDELDAIEKKIEMIEYISSNILRSLEYEVSNLKDIFKASDERKVILNFIRRDVGSFSDYLDTKKNLDEADEKIDTILDSLIFVLPDA